jgi:hypothetical protein
MTESNHHVGFQSGDTPSKTPGFIPGTRFVRR